MTAREIPLRVVVERPPQHVTFRVQRGKTNFVTADLLAPVRSTRQQLVFEFGMRLGPRVAAKPPTRLGVFAQGPASARFIYLNSGTLAGQCDSC